MKKLLLSFALLIFTSNIYCQDELLLNGDGDGGSWNYAETCSSYLYDAGGESIWLGQSGDLDYIITICPDIGGNLEAIFEYFYLWPGDTLWIYDGIELITGSGNVISGVAQIPGSPFTDFEGLSGAPNIGQSYVAGSSGNSDLSGCLSIRLKTSSIIGADFIMKLECATACPNITAAALASDPFAFDIDSLDICAGTEIPFSGDAVYTADSSSGPFEYYWNFGDGTAEVQQKQPTHTYASSGIYYLQMWAQEGNCASNIVEKMIRVSSGDGITFSDVITADTICIQDTTAYIDATGAAAGEVVYGELPSPNSGTLYIDHLDPPSVLEKEIDYSSVFDAGKTLTSEDQITSINVNLEHSYIGYLALEVECPNGQSVFIYNEPPSWSTTPVTMTSTYNYANFGEVLTDATDGNLYGVTQIGTGYLYKWFDQDGANAAGKETVEDYAQLIGNTVLPLNHPMQSDRRLIDQEFLSIGDFAALEGCPLDGVWKLKLHMLSAGASVDGFLFDFSIDFDSTLYDLTTEYSPEIDSLIWICDGDMTIHTQDGDGRANIQPQTEGAKVCTLRAYDNVGCYRDTVINFIGKDCIDCVPPTVFNGVINSCDDGDGTGVFDLSSAEADINPFEPLLNVVFFEDIGLTSLITDPASYVSASETVYARVGPEGLCSSLATLQLTLGNVSLTPIIDTKCAMEGSDSATFNLDDYADVLTGGDSTITIRWFEDIDHTIPVTDNLDDYQTENTTLYVIGVGQTSCTSSTTVTLTAGPIEANNQTITECIQSGSNSYDFDLTIVESDVNSSSLYNFNWYSDQAKLFAIADPTSHTGLDGDSVFVEVNDGGSCINNAVVNLELTTAPVVFNGVYEICSDDVGVPIDLNSLKPDIAPNDYLTASFNWCEDPACLTSITDPSNYIITQSITVYAHVGDGCTATSSVDFNIVNGQANQVTINACDEGGGIGLFDLEGSQTSINNNNGVGFVWYSDAGLTNVITEVTAYSSAPTNVYVTVSDGICSATIEIPLEIGLSQAQDTSLSACSYDAAIFNLTDADLAVGGGNAVTWYEDSRQTVQITDPTSYTGVAGIVYATIGSGECISVGEVTLIIDPIPIAYDVVIRETESFNGTAVFDLSATAVAEGVRGGQSGSVSFYYDLDLTQELTGESASNFSSSGTTVVALLDNGKCSDTSTIRLIVEQDSNIVRIPDSLVLIMCNAGTGTATFDLTTLDVAMNKGTGNIVSWFRDGSLSSSIDNPSAFVSGETRVYCAVNTFNGVGIADLYLVSPDKVGETVNIQMCDNGNGQATFDLTVAIDKINRGSGYEILWYEDQSKITPISGATIANYTSSTGTIFAEVVLPEGACDEVIPVPINLIVVDELRPRNGEISICGDGTTGTFNLSLIENYLTDGFTYNIEWYEDESLSVQIGDIRNYVSTNALIYARFSAGPNCDAVSEVTLSVGELKIRPTKLYACSEIANEAVFNLIRSESYIMYGVEHSALWYQDAKLADNILTPGRYKSPTKTVWIDVTVENDSGCSTNSPIELEVLNLNPIDTLMTYCDDNVEGKSFNLRDLDAIMNQNTGLEVSWHKTANRINSINNPSLYIPTAYTDGVHTVYAEICGNVAEVKLVVFEKDSFSINMTSDEYLIDQGEKIDLITSGKAFNHIWSPATGLSDTVGYAVSASPNQTTAYQVYIYNDAGCSTLDTVTVYVRETEEDLKEVIAEIFTPDGNGTNDELFVQGPGVCSVDLKIFNRWGVLVFETTNPEIGWNGGKMNDLNDPVPADDYRYTLSVKHCGQGDEREVKEPGIITIIR